MGYKCPICLEDFKRDLGKWKGHIKEKHEGVAEEIDQWIRNQCKQGDENE